MLISLTHQKCQSKSVHLDSLSVFAVFDTVAQ